MRFVGGLARAPRPPHLPLAPPRRTGARAADYTDLIQHPPPGFDLHVVRASKSERWTATSVALMQRAAEAHRRPTPHSGTFHYHELPNSGHWVHVDNPQGLMDMIVPCLAHVQ